MKNIKFIFAALVSLAALSCDKESLPQSTPETDQDINQDSDMMTLILSTGEQTKTHISNVTSNGVTEIHWDEGDKIAVFSDEENSLSNDKNKYSFSMSDNPNGNFAKFEGKIAAKSENIWAVYPASNAKSCSTDGNGSDIVASIPSSQTPVAKSFASNLNISVAKAKVTKVNSGSLGSWGGDYELSETIFVNFKNVCTLLKFTAPENADQITSVTITANENIAGDMTIDYSGDEPKVTKVSGSNSITMTGSFVAGQEYYFVLAPVNISGISMTIQANNETRYIANKANIALQAGVAKNLGNVNLTKMSKVSAEAVHQYPSNVLSGTNVNFDLGTNSISSVDFSIKKTNDTPNRSAKAITSAYSSDDKWPYLPKGEYTFSGTFISNGVSVVVPTTSFNVSAPTVKVNDFTPFTSYSKYLDGKPSVANELDGSTIYANVTVSVATAILENNNYSSMIKVNDAAPVYKTVEGVKCVCFGGKKWESHTISQIKWTFDSVESTKTITSKTVQVTGLPYKLSAEKEDSGWTKNGTVKWNETVVEINMDNTDAGKVVKLGNGKTSSSSISRTFPLPADTNVSISTKGTSIATAYSKKVGTSLGFIPKYEYWYYENIGSVKVGNETIASANTKTQTNVTAYINPREVQFTKNNYETTLNAEKAITCSNSYDENNCYTGIYSLSVNYR